MTTESQPFSIDSLDDNMFGGDFANEDESTENPSTAPSDEESEDEDEEELEESEAPQQEEAPQPDQGPGDLKVALRQARENERQTKAQFQALQQQFQQVQAHLNAINEREQRALWEAQVRREVESIDPDDVPAYLQAKEMERQQQLQGQMQQQNQALALKLSEDSARVALPDYDAQVSKLLGIFGRPIAEWSLTQENPALAVYEKAKTIFTQDEVDQLVENRVQERLAEINSRSNGRKQQASSPRINSLPAAANAKVSDPLKGVRKGLNAQVGSQDWHRSIDRLFEMTAE